MLFVTWESGPSGAFWFWLAACLATELLWVRLPAGGATLSMASCCNFAALLLLSQGEAMLVAVASVFAAELLFLRKPVYKSLFNAGQTALAVGCASLIIVWIGGGAGGPLYLLSPMGFLALILGAAVYFLINSGAVSVAVAISEWRSVRTIWMENYGSYFELLCNVVLFAIAYLAAISYAYIGPGVTACLLLLLILADRGYQRHVGKKDGVTTWIRRAA
jgi:hypothetical protein